MTLLSLALHNSPLRPRRRVRRTRGDASTRGDANTRACAAHRRRSSATATAMYEESTSSRRLPRQLRRCARLGDDTGRTRRRTRRRTRERCGRHAPGAWDEHIGGHDVAHARHRGQIGRFSAESERRRRRLGTKRCAVAEGVWRCVTVWGVRTRCGARCGEYSDGEF